MEDTPIIDEAVTVLGLGRVCDRLHAAARPGVGVALAVQLWVEAELRPAAVGRVQAVRAAAVRGHVAWHSGKSCSADPCRDLTCEGVAHDVEAGGEGGEPQQGRHAVLQQGG